RMGGQGPKMSEYSWRSLTLATSMSKGLRSSSSPGRTSVRDSGEGKVETEASVECMGSRRGKGKDGDNDTAERRDARDSSSISVSVNWSSKSSLAKSKLSETAAHKKSPSQDRGQGSTSGTSLEMPAVRLEL